jgi:hypothetical protein
LALPYNLDISMKKFKLVLKKIKVTKLRIPVRIRENTKSKYVLIWQKWIISAGTLKFVLRIGSLYPQRLKMMEFKSITSRWS